MVRHGGGPADCAEIDRFEALELLEPVRRHHFAVLDVVIAVGPLKCGEFQVDVEFACGGLYRAQAFRHDFLTDAVTGNHSDFMGFHRSLSEKIGRGGGDSKLRTMILHMIHNIMRHYVMTSNTNREQSPA